MKNILPPELDKELYHEIGQILQMKPIYVKPGLTEKQKEQGYLVHMATTLTEMFQRKLSAIEMEPLEESQNDPVKLLLEKFGLATVRYIKGVINREERERIYDEVHLGLTQEGSPPKIEPKKKVIFFESYCGDALCDIERDVLEALDGNFNDKMKDHQEFNDGEFEVTINWVPNK